MMCETGRVVAIESDAFWVETVRNSSCGNCAGNDRCGHGLIAKMYGPVHHRVRVRLRDGDPPAPDIGEQVVIGLPEQSLLFGSLLVYLVPTLTLTAGAVMGSVLGGSDLAALSGAVVGLLSGLLATRWIISDRRRAQYFEPRWCTDHSHRPATPATQ